MRSSTVHFFFIAIYYRAKAATKRKRNQLHNWIVLGFNFVRTCTKKERDLASSQISLIMQNYSHCELIFIHFKAWQISPAEMIRLLT
uniref:Secreted protein n=1 Tax=Trichogramma kaykai TaxID=54128 RepID=A0ABD2VWY6_9HYME